MEEKPRPRLKRTRPQKTTLEGIMESYASLARMMLARPEENRDDEYYDKVNDLILDTEETIATRGVDEPEYLAELYERLEEGRPGTAAWAEFLGDHPELEPSPWGVWRNDGPDNDEIEAAIRQHFGDGREFTTRELVLAMFGPDGEAVYEERSQAFTGRLHTLTLDGVVRRTRKRRSVAEPTLWRLNETLR